MQELWEGWEVWLGQQVPVGPRWRGVAERYPPPLSNILRTKLISTNFVAVFICYIGIVISVSDSGFLSGSGSAKNPDPIRKSGSRSMKKTPYKYNFFYFPHWVQTVFFGHVAPKPIQKHHLDPISLLMDGSGFLQSGSRSAKNPDPSGSKTLIVIA